MAPPRNRRPGFSRRAQYGLFLGYVIAVAGAAVAAVLLAISAFDPTAFAAFRAALAEATAPVSTAGAWVGSGLSVIPESIGNHFGVMGENARLKKQLADEAALIMRARTIAYDNRRLKALLALRDRISDPVVTARLVSSSATSTRRYALLNAGSRQGVQSGQPVTGPAGLIGRVLEAGLDTARVLLVTDPESIVPVRRTRDGMPALAVGRGDGLVDIKSVNVANADFKPDDVFVTTGTGGIYDPGIRVARAMQPGRDTAPGKPFAHPDTLDFALVSRAFMPLPVETPKPAPSPKPKSPKLPKPRPKGK